MIASYPNEQLCDGLVIGMIDADRDALAAGFADKRRGLGHSAAKGESSGVWLRPVTYTVAPDCPSAMAMPLPAPRLPPVTTATISMIHPRDVQARAWGRPSFGVQMPSQEAELLPRRIVDVVFEAQERTKKSNTHH